MGWILMMERSLWVTVCVFGVAMVDLIMIGVKP
jgi:hypothetical protein